MISFAVLISSSYCFKASNFSSFVISEIKIFYSNFCNVQTLNAANNQLKYINLDFLTYHPSIKSFTSKISKESLVYCEFILNQQYYISQYHHHISWFLMFHLHILQFDPNICYMYYYQKYYILYHHIQQ